MGSNPINGTNLIKGEKQYETQYRQRKGRRN